VADLDPQLDFDGFDFARERHRESGIALSAQAWRRGQELLGRLDRSVGNGEHELAVQSPVTSNEHRMATSDGVAMMAMRGSDSKRNLA